jgi:putative transposase
MTTPSGRREALEILTCRGLSQRKACSYLGCSRRVAGYQLVQPDKDKICLLYTSDAADDM